jgi:hypothetical protein
MPRLFLSISKTRDALSNGEIGESDFNEGLMYFMIGNQTPDQVFGYVLKSLQAGGGELYILFREAVAKAQEEGRCALVGMGTVSQNLLRLNQILSSNSYQVLDVSLAERYSPGPGMSAWGSFLQLVKDHCRELDLFV